MELLFSQLFLTNPVDYENKERTVLNKSNNNEDNDDDNGDDDDDDDCDRNFITSVMKINQPSEQI